MLDWQPPTSAVAALIPGRTAQGGGEHPDFTDRTSPTRQRVQELIEQATREVAAAVGYELDPDVRALAGDVTATRAAMSIELGEASRGKPNTYASLRETYTHQLPILIAAAKQAREDGEQDPGPVDDTGPSVHAAFPPAHGIRW